jgi:hypothetical protein
MHQKAEEAEYPVVSIDNTKEIEDNAKATEGR